MNKYDVMEPRKGRDGFYDETLPMFTIMHDVDAKTANHYMMYHLEYRLYARDTKTGEMFHGTAHGLRNVNSY